MEAVSGRGGQTEDMRRHVPLAGEGAVAQADPQRHRGLGFLEQDLTRDVPHAPAASAASGSRPF